MGDLDLGADRAQFLGGVVQHFTPVGDAARDGFNDARGWGQQAHQFRQMRGAGGELLEIAGERAGGDQRAHYRKQFSFGEHTAAAGKGGERADVVSAAHAEV